MTAAMIAGDDRALAAHRAGEGPVVVGRQQHAARRPAPPPKARASGPARCGRSSTACPVPSLATASGQACSRSTRGSTKSSSERAPTRALKPRSRARATSLVQLLVLGIAQLVGRAGHAPAVGRSAGRRRRRAAARRRSTCEMAPGLRRGHSGRGSEHAPAAVSRRFDPGLADALLAQAIAEARRDRGC